MYRQSPAARANSVHPGSLRCRRIEHAHTSSLRADVMHRSKALDMVWYVPSPIAMGSLPLFLGGIMFVEP